MARAQTTVVAFFMTCALLPLTALAEQDLLRRQAYLGASLRPPTSARAGAEVLRVTPETSAAAAGLQPGDLILKIGDKLLTDPVTFATVNGSLRGGDTVSFEILRNGEVMTKQVTLAPLPLEQLPGLDVTYGSVLTDRGHRLRTITTVPQGATGKLPGLLLVSWLSCNSAEFPLGATTGFAKLIHGLATESGAVFLRVDKPGAGDSGGPACIEADFESELAGYRAALRALKQHPAVDPDRIFIFGMSNGGGIAPLVVQEEKVRGYVVTGGWMKTWFEHMIENERRRLTLLGKSPSEVSEGVKGFSAFYTDYLIHEMTPAEILRQRPHLASLWYDLPEHQYGRPAAFYHQLQDLNLAAAWDKVSSPVLVLYGEHDWIMSREDHEMIAQIVNRNHPGTAQFVAIPKMDHLFHINESMKKSFDDYASGKFDPSLITLIVDWIKRHS